MNDLPADRDLEVEHRLTHVESIEKQVDRHEGLLFDHGLWIAKHDEKHAFIEGTEQGKHLWQEWDRTTTGLVLAGVGGLITIVVFALTWGGHLAHAIFG